MPLLSLWNPEGGDITFLRSVGKSSPDYMASFPMVYINSHLYLSSSKKSLYQRYSVRCTVVVKNPSSLTKDLVFISEFSVFMQKYH
jgi:hypothetical protein